jgi:hypothetical protein
VLPIFDSTAAIVIPADIHSGGDSGRWVRAGVTPLPIQQRGNRHERRKAASLQRKAVRWTTAPPAEPAPSWPSGQPGELRVHNRMVFEWVPDGTLIVDSLPDPLL